MENTSTTVEVNVVERRYIIGAALCLINEYFETYICKTPCMTSSDSGDKWIGELLVGHPGRFHNMFRMSQSVFIDLLHDLESCHGLHGSLRTTLREVLGITLYILSHNESIRAACERFQYSTETVSRYFSVGLDALLSLSTQVVKPTDPSFQSIPEEILHDQRYMSYFKECIGAIDGTHIDVRVPNREKVAYIGRCGLTTQNVMAVCDFNICFTFIMTGWEGSAHDSRIFKFATRNRHFKFPMPPTGCKRSRGDSMDAKDLVFSIKRRSALLQLHEEWFVYLAANTEEENCDFRITGSYRKKNYTIYKGASSFVVAQFTKDHKPNLPLKKHTFGATLSANCDYSFVAALIAIFHKVYVKNSATSASHIRNMHHLA